MTSRCVAGFDSGDNLLFGILLNMTTAYMMNMNFTEATACLEEAYQINSKNSLLFYRWSQVYSYDELANKEQLLQARELIKQAMECYSKERLFRDQGKMVLKMLNLHNVAEALEYQRNFVESQLNHKEREETAMIGGTRRLKQTLSRRPSIAATSKMNSSRKASCLPIAWHHTKVGDL